jgi:hypothetical protein
VGLDDAELSTEVGEAACSASSDGGVLAADEADGGSLARSRCVLGAAETAESVRTCCCDCFERERLWKELLLGDDAGVGVLESR